MSAVIASEFSSIRIRGRLMMAVFLSQGWGSLGEKQITLMLRNAQHLQKLQSHHLYHSSWSLHSNPLFRITHRISRQSMLCGGSSSVSGVFPASLHCIFALQSQRAHDTQLTLNGMCYERLKRSNCI